LAALTTALVAPGWANSSGADEELPVRAVVPGLSCSSCSDSGEAPWVVFASALQESPDEIRSFSEVSADGSGLRTVGALPGTWDDYPRSATDI
jgi:hypothetical protein